MAKLNIYRLAGHLTFLVLFILSSLFYLERTIFIDAAYQTFNLIQAKGFQTYAGRFGVVLSEIIPLIAIKLGMGLEQILFIVSITATLIPYLVFMVCSSILRSDAAGFTVVLIMILCVRNSFYLIGTEATQALVCSMLLLAWLQWPGQKHSFGHIAVTLILIVFCSFTHPVAIIPLFYIGCYHACNYDWKTSNWKVLVAPLGVTIVGACKLILGHTASHDSMHLTKINLETASHVLFNFFDMFAVSFLVNHTFFDSNRYLPWLFIMVITLGILLFRKKYGKATVMLAGTGCFLFISNMIYKNGESGIMMEKALVPLSIFVGVPLMTDVLTDRFSRSYWILGLLVVIVFIRMRDISKASRSYTQRLGYIERVIAFTQQKGDCKFVIERRNISGKHIRVSWAFAMETLLYSSLQSPDSARTIYVVDDLKTLNANLGNQDLFMAVPFYRDKRSSSLDHSYFQLSNTPYTKLRQIIE